MKKIRLAAMLLMACVLLGGCSNEDSDRDSDISKYMDEQEEIMDHMTERMEDIQKTGDVNLDFLYGMIPHHESAVDMSNSYLKYANDNNAFKQLAQNIIDAQNKEIKQMQDMITAIKARMPEGGAGSEEQYSAYVDEYDRMMKEHDSHNWTAKDLDAAFAEGMTMHHQMAVDMAKSVLKYSDDEELKAFAQNIIDVQEQEIGEMKAYLGDDGTQEQHH